MNLIISCLFFVSTIAISTPIPVSVFLQPIPTHHHCRPYCCYNPWAPTNSHMMVPMVTGVLHPVPRTYILRLLKTNSTYRDPQISSTTELLPSCPIPSLMNLNATEKTIPLNTTEIPPAAQDPITINNDVPKKGNDQKIIIQSMSHTESGMVSSITTANTNTFIDTTSMAPKEQNFTKTDNQAVEKTTSIPDSAVVKNESVPKLTAENIAKQKIELLLEKDLTRNKPGLIKSEDADDIVSNQI